VIAAYAQAFVFDFLGVHGTDTVSATLITGIS
jgi:hypothetical protein